MHDVFISHAAEQQVLAEQIAYALANAGYSYFLADHNVRRGQEFNSNIARAINRSRMFLFLVSVNSVQPGKYTLSEIKYAAERWKRPSGRILAVITDGVSPDRIPPYLAASSILRPAGNVVAEVVHEVGKIINRRRRQAIVVSVTSLIALCFIGSLIFYFAPPLSRQLFRIVSPQTFTPVSVSIPPSLRTGFTRHEIAQLASGDAVYIGGVRFRAEIQLASNALNATIRRIAVQTKPVTDPTINEQFKGATRREVETNFAGASRINTYYVDLRTTPPRARMIGENNMKRDLGDPTVNLLDEVPRPTQITLLRPSDTIFSLDLTISFNFGQLTEVYLIVEGTHDGHDFEINSNMLLGH